MKKIILIWIVVMVLFNLNVFSEDDSGSVMDEVVDGLKGKSVNYDDMDDWAEGSLELMYDTGIMKGYPNNKFGLYNYLGGEDANVIIKRYNDWAEEKGLPAFGDYSFRGETITRKSFANFFGTGLTGERENDPIRRGEAAAIISRRILWDIAENDETGLSEDNFNFLKESFSPTFVEKILQDYVVSESPVAPLMEEEEPLLSGEGPGQPSAAVYGSVTINLRSIGGGYLGKIGLEVPLDEEGNPIANVEQLKDIWVDKYGLENVDTSSIIVEVVQTGEMSTSTQMPTTGEVFELHLGDGSVVEFMGTKSDIENLKRSGASNIVGYAPKAQVSYQEYLTFGYEIKSDGTILINGKEVEQDRSGNLLLIDDSGRTVFFRLNRRTNIIEPVESEGVRSGVGGDVSRYYDPLTGEVTRIRIEDQLIWLGDITEERSVPIEIKGETYEFRRVNENFIYVVHDNSYYRLNFGPGYLLQRMSSGDVEGLRKDYEFKIMMDGKPISTYGRLLPEEVDSYLNELKVRWGEGNVREVGWVTSEDIKRLSREGQKFYLVNIDGEYHTFTFEQYEDIARSGIMGVQISQLEKDLIENVQRNPNSIESKEALLVFYENNPGRVRGNEELVVSNMENLADLYLRSGMYDEAIPLMEEVALYYESFDLRKSVETRKKIIDSLKGKRGYEEVVHEFIQKNIESIEANIRGLEKGPKVFSENDLIEAYKYAAEQYEDMGQIEAALKKYQKAYELVKKKPDTDPVKKDLKEKIDDLGGQVREIKKQAKAEYISGILQGYMWGELRNVFGDFTFGVPSKICESLFDTDLGISMSVGSSTDISDYSYNFNIATIQGYKTDYSFENTKSYVYEISFSLYAGKGEDLNYKVKFERGDILEQGELSAGMFYPGYLIIQNDREYSSVCLSYDSESLCSDLIET